MLSILLPVYNYNIVEIVNDLSSQCVKLNIEHEILCYDDKSKKSFLVENSSVKEINSVVYKELESNIGRSKIRNLLGKDSKFENLLFLDCDIKIIDENYIKNYISKINAYEVIVGGVAYFDFHESKDLYLRWKYGKCREERSATARSKHAYRAFSACNLLIKKEVFDDIKFSENLSKYGHEDTIFGLFLKEKNIAITHFENPIYHIGLDEASLFLQKTEDSLDNLLLVSKQVDLKNDIKIYSYYRLIKKTIAVTYPIFEILKSVLKKKILNGNSNLLLFDLYKLSYLLCSKN